MGPPSRTSHEGTIRPGSAHRAVGAPSIAQTNNGRSLTTALQPRIWINDLSLMPRKFVRRLLGLNPFQTSYWSLYRPLSDWRSRSILVLGILCSIAAGVPLPIIGVIFSHIIDNFPPAEDELATSIGELLGVAVAYFFVTWGWSICWGITGEKVSRGLREAMVEKVVGMDMMFFDVENPDMTSILTGDTQTIQMGTSEKVGLFIQSISYFVAAFVVGFILNATLTGILLAAVIPTMIIVVISGTTAVSKLSKRATELTDAAADVASSAIDAVGVVQAFGANGVLSDNHFAILARATRAGFKKSLAGAIMLGCVYFTAYSANALAFFEGNRLANGGGAGTIYAVVFLILDASFVVGQFGPFIQTFAQAAAAGGKVLDLIDHAPPEIDPYADDGLPSDHSTFKQDLVVDKVSFWYPSRATVRVLDQVDLRFRSGTTTGIVGMSGSGKSTVASLLLRLYDPTKGEIRLGNTDIRDFNVTQLRAQMALVDQDPVLFTGTILENIRHGIPNADRMTDREVYERCCRAAVDANANFIPALSDGIHTRIGGQGGTWLSGGQRQRICLARALAREPALLVLDEPTSALDTVSESLILQALARVSGRGCTVIMIAHRLATIKDADNIIVMGHGQFLEQGKHDDLVANEGPYTALVRAQGLFNPHKNDAPYLMPSPATSSDSSLIKPTMEKFENTTEKNTEQDVQKDQPASHSPWYLIKRCMKLSRPEAPLITLGILASMTSGAIIIAEAIIFGHLVSLINTPTDDIAAQRSQVQFFCLMFFVTSLVALVAYTISGTSFGLVSETLILRVRDISLRNILRQDMAWFGLPGHSPHELMASINMDVGHLSGLSGVIIGTVFSVCTSIIGGIILAHIIAWRIAVVLLSAVPVMIVAGFLRLRVLSKFEERHETAYNAAAALASEACRSIRTVAAFGRERDVLRQYQKAIEVPYKQSFKFNVAGNLMLAISLAITYFVYALAYWWGATNVREGRYTEQDFFIVLPALLFSAQSSGQMFSLAPEVTRAKSAANSVFRLHDEEPTIMHGESIKTRGRRFGRPSNSMQRDETHAARTDNQNAGEEEKAGIHERGEQGAVATGDTRQDELQTETGRVELDNVTLIYPSRPKDPVFEELSMGIESGQFIGVVGPSGAGKSSLVSLLERYYDPAIGAVRLDGEDIRLMPAIDYRQRLSLVSQESDLFSGTIAFNIGLGRRRGQEVSLHDIEEVCQQCGLHDFIMGLPEGYQTDCGTNGSKLSGGQRQRIAVARALIRDPEVLLLDEATASLDSHTEAQVHQAMMAASRNRTTIVVAHRLSTVQKADRIFVFDGGRVVETGTHAELLAKGGIYTGMVHAQNLA